MRVELCTSRLNPPVPIQASSRLAAAAIPHATLLEYAGAPHGLFATEKDRLVRDLLHFLKQ